MSENETMSEKSESDDERPCLHCLISDLINEFYDEYGSNSGEEDTIDVDEILTAVAKVVAHMTSSCAATLRRHILEQLPRAIAKFEAEFSAEDANASESQVRH